MYRRVENGLSKHWDFIIVDLFMLELSLFLAYLIRYNGAWPVSDTPYRNLLLLLPLLHIVTAFLINNYSGIVRRGYLRELHCTIIQCCAVAVFMLLCFLILHTTNQYSTTVLFLVWGIAILLIYAGRVILKKVLKHMGDFSLELPHLVIVASAKEAARLVEELKANSYNRYRVSGVIYSDAFAKQGEMVKDIPVVADMRTYEEYMRQEVVDEVFVALKLTDPYISRIISPIEEIGATLHLRIPSLLPTAFPQTVSHIGSYTAVTSSPKMVTQTQMLLKRLIDIASALAGLLLTGIAFLFVAPIVKKQAPGPIFFSQTRVGRNGRQFKIYKFRSMYTDAEERKKELMAQNQMQGLMFKMENDPRIFPFGHFLRKSSIDELPQFWNVLKGDMSLVGTRPPTLDEYRHYELHHKFRLAFKPGITGLWQVSGRSSITDFEDVVKLDSEYIRNWSLGLDIKIILKTFKVVLKRGGAE